MERTHCETPLSASAETASTRKTVLLHLLILLLVAVAVTRSMWGPAMLAGHSAWIDLARAVEFDAAIRAGDFFPTWSPDLYSGYGSPIFQFYAPLVYYVVEIPALAGCDLPTALKVTQLLVLFGSGLTMYRLASTHLSGWAACVGGVFYMVAPYRLVDMFIRHALAEHAAFLWLPLIVWGTERFLAQRSRGGLVTGALASAALIFTHNIMALIGFPVCIAAGWALAGPRRGLLPLVFAGVVGVLGVGLATFFWWPAMSGRPLTQAEASLTGGYFDFHRHFVTGWQFLDPHWGFGISGAKPGDAMPLQIGLPHLFTGLTALVMLLTRQQGDGDAGQRRVVWSIVGLLVMAIGIFMCSRGSQFLWETLPLVKYVQFPWRFLGLVVFGAALCAIPVADRLAALGGRAALLAPVGMIVVIMAAYFPYYSQARFLVASRQTGKLAALPADEVDALQAAGSILLLGRSTTAGELRRMHERATSSDDFLPRDVKQQPATPPVQMIEVADGEVRSATHVPQNRYRGRLHASAPSHALLRQFWFPGWEATVDGTPVLTGPDGPSALVSCAVPAGDHTVEFHYRSLPQRRIGWLVSLLSLVLLIGALLAGRLRQRSSEGHIA